MVIYVVTDTYVREMYDCVFCYSTPYSNTTSSGMIILILQNLRERNPFGGDYKLVRIVGIAYLERNAEVFRARYLSHTQRIHLIRIRPA